MNRNREFERLATIRIASAPGLDMRPLIQMAERRADQAQAEYGHDFPALDRDLERETMEELADARNYVVWRLDAIHRGVCEDLGRTEHLQLGLRHVAAAFECFRQAQR